jgi:hypothetical protein
MPDYEITAKYNDEGAQSARGTAEHVYSHLLPDMLYRSRTLEIRNKKTGEVETIELEADLENDESLMWFITLIGVVVKFMTEEQRRELEEWEKEDMNEQGTSTSDWPRLERIIGKPPI